MTKIPISAIWQPSVVTNSWTILALCSVWTLHAAGSLEVLLHQQKDSWSMMRISETRWTGNGEFIQESRWLQNHLGLLRKIWWETPRRSCTNTWKRCRSSSNWLQGSVIKTNQGKIQDVLWDYDINTGLCPNVNSQWQRYGRRLHQTADSRHIEQRSFNNNTRWSECKG